jgi:hypothetical protein
MPSAPARVAPLALDRVSRVVGRGDRDERLARARVADLASVAHPGVCVPLDVAREDDAVVACSPRVAGVALSGAGPVEELGEWVWLVASLADALAALHSAGLSHGDVSPANVIVGMRPVLIDLVGAALGRERGTPGFAAPERARGGPSPAADVYALGAVALAVAGDAIRTQAEAWMEPLLAQDPDARPTAAAVAAGLARCAAPVRWRPEVDVPRPGMPRPARTERDPRAWAWRLVRRPVRTLAIVLACVAAIAWIAWGPDLGASEPPARAAELAADSVPADPAPVLGPPAPVAAAVALTTARGQALAAGDGDALVAMTVPGSGAWATASREARSLEEGTVFEGLVIAERGAVQVESEGDNGAPDAPRRALVAVTYEVSPHTRSGPDGHSVAVPAHTQTALLALEWSGTEWRVAEVSDPP